MKKFIREKKERELIEEDISEDWCFLCKDGGSLRVCDYWKCPKAYHAECVEEDGSFLHSKSKWTCRWHFCFNCNKPSKYHCFCCPTAVCQSCVNIVEFAPLRDTKGFCHPCLKLALLGEANETANSDGEPIDFNNRETFECLFLECWFITKKEEKLTLEDLQTASSFLKNRNKRNTSDPLVSEISESDTKSDSYTKDARKEVKSTHVKKRSKCEPSASKRKPEKSKPELLIEFLTSIGKQTSKELSQYEVTSIIGRYISENNLFNPGKKNKVLCDQRLESLFQKKTFNRNQLLDLLRPHFAKNTELTEHDDDEDQLVSNRKKITSRTFKQVAKMKHAAEMEKLQEVPKICFAAIVEENIKIAFLMKSLVKQLLDNHQSEAFDSKVIGCFVKIRSDPLDYLQKNRCQLVLITGVNRILQEDETKVTLQASTGLIHIELEMEKLLDVMFDEEELDDLRKRVDSGLIPRPTIVDLEMKAKSLHVELTNHAIDKELRSLEYHIDAANLKGRRAELIKHLNRKELLKSPEERKRMVEKIPRVVAALVEFNEPPTFNGQAGETLGSKESNASMPVVNEDQLVSNTKKRAWSTIKKAAEIKKVHEVPKSLYAAIVEDNIKIAFLMKSLVKQLLDNHQPEDFDSKVIGCFVKIRSDPMDYLQKNRCQLVLITGVKRILQGDGVKVTLQASTGIICIDLEIEKLLDVIFDQEELDDLRKRVEDGLIPRPTVVDLELKAKSLHVELTNHAIDKELRSLEYHIDAANLNGWRAELFKHLNRKELLKSPEERKRMVETIPPVVAALVEFNEPPTGNGQAGETLGPKESNASMPVVNEDQLVSNTKKRTWSTTKKAAEIKKLQEVPKSLFAAIVEDNIKIVFLMKSLVKQLLDNHQPEEFDSKVIGCFVKIRSDPMDYLQKNRCQLVLITGVKRILQDDVVKVTMQVSTGITSIDIEIEKLLDVIFDEEELDDLRKRVEDSLIPRPTVVDLELKAKSLHVELTNHAIDKELQSLEYRIDTANLNGCRAKLFKHLNRKKLLKSPEERKRMLETIPHVIPAPTGFDREPPNLNGQAGATLEEVPVISAGENKESQEMLITDLVVAVKTNEPEDQVPVRTNFVVAGENDEPEAIPNLAIAGKNQQSNRARKEPPNEVIYIDSEDDDDW